MIAATKTGNAAAFLILLLTVFAAACVSKSQPRASKARPRVAVVVEGKLSEPVVTAVDEALSRDYLLLSKREYQSTAKSLKAKSMSPKDVREVAEKLALSSVVYATVRGKRVKLELRDGGTGKPAWRFSAKLKRKELRAKDRRALKARLLSRAGSVESKNQKRRARIEEKERREQAKRERKEEKLRAAQEKKDAREQAKRERKEEKLRAAQEKKDAAEKAKREKEEEKARIAAEREQEKRDIEAMQIKTDEKGQAIDDEDPTP